MSTTADTAKSFPFVVDGETDPGTYGVIGLRVRDSVGYVTTFATEGYAKQNEGCVVVDLSVATVKIQVANAGSGGGQNQGAQDQDDQNQGTPAGSNGATSAPATGNRQTTTLAKTRLSHAWGRRRS